MTPLLILGCGYLGQRVALLHRHESPAGSVTGTVRSAERAADLDALGISSAVANVLEPETLAALPLPPAILYCVGFDRSAGHSMRSVYVDGLRSFLDHLVKARWSGRFVYVSSTGVYSQDTGGWVDEDSPAEPRQENGKICLEAEELVRRYAMEHRWKAVRVRLSGIYGPNRLMRKDSIERGEPIVGDPQRWLNLIHVEDAARACLKLLNRPSPRDLYLASDDRPIRRGEYYATLAGFLGLEPPRFVPADPSSPASSREATSKRVRNAALKADLRFSFLYPEITQGIPASLSGNPGGASPQIS